MSLSLTGCLKETPEEGIDSGKTSGLQFNGAESAEAISHSKIILTFSPASGGTGSYTYSVYVNNDFSTPLMVRGGLSPNSNNKIQLTATGLTIATQYDFIVRVTDGQSTEFNNHVVTASTFSYPTPDFNGISLLEAEPGLNGTTRLRAFWPVATAYPGTVLGGYNIYLRPKGGSFNFSIPYMTAGAGANETFITGLTSNTEYDVIVRAYDTFGREEKNINMKSAKTRQSLPISFLGVMSVAPASGIAGFNSLNISWIPGLGDFDRYHVYVSNSNIGLLAVNDPYWNSPYTIVFDTSASSLVLTALSPKQTYYVVVRAINGLIPTGETNTIARSAKTEPPLPQFLGAKTIAQPAGAAGLTQLKISWDAATGAFNRYHIFQKVAGVYDYTTPTATAASSATSITMSGLTTGTQYCYVVRAAYDAIAPVHTETNTVEVCATPQYQPPTFDGLASCTVDSTPGMAPIRINISWQPATGIFDQYHIWQSTSSSIDFNSVPTQVIASSLSTRLMSNLQPNTTYYFAVRAHYTSLNVNDGNTVVVPCLTETVSLQFTQLTNGYKNAGNRFINSTQVCLKDTANANVPMAASVVMTKASGAGTLGGTLTKALINGCATFDDLTYTDVDTLTLQAAIGGVATQTSDPIAVVNPGAPPPGACLNDKANFVTAYGGCYNLSTGLVVAKASPTVMQWDNAIWEAKTDLSDVEPHDNVANDMNANGKPDELDPASTDYTMAANNILDYCHSLVEGGYQDWRVPKFSEASALISAGIAVAPVAVSLPASYWTSTRASSTTAYIFTGATAAASNSYGVLCVRNAETSYTNPTAPSSLNATVAASFLGASEVNLNWAAGGGSTTGYAIWWAPVADGIDFDAEPNAVIRAGLTSYTAKGLLPGTQYEFAVRSAFTRTSPMIFDANTNKATATTKNARIEIRVFNGHRLGNDKIPVYVEVVEDVTGLKILSKNLPLEVETIQGLDVVGTTAILANDGIGKFVDLNYADFTGTGQIQLRIKSDYTASADTALVTVPLKAAGTCHDFSKDVYPDHGGCYFKNINKVTSAKSSTSINNFDRYLWESGPGPTFTSKEPTDTIDNDGDGSYDDLDPTSDPRAGYMNTYCHDLIEGGRSDWRAMWREDTTGLTTEGFKKYSFLKTDMSDYTFPVAYYPAGYCTSLYRFDTDALTSWPACTPGGSSRMICIRTP